MNPTNCQRVPSVIRSPHPRLMSRRPPPCRVAGRRLHSLRHPRLAPGTPDVPAARAWGPPDAAGAARGPVAPAGARRRGGAAGVAASGDSARAVSAAHPPRQPHAPGRGQVLVRGRPHGLPQHQHVPHLRRRHQRAHVVDALPPVGVLAARRHLPHGNSARVHPALARGHDERPRVGRGVERHRAEAPAPLSPLGPSSGAATPYVSPVHRHHAGAEAAGASTPAWCSTPSPAAPPAPPAPRP